MTVDDRSFAAFAKVHAEKARHYVVQVRDVTGQYMDRIRLNRMSEFFPSIFQESLTMRKSNEPWTGPESRREDLILTKLSTFL
jgi:hypothetical protein